MKPLPEHTQKLPLEPQDKQKLLKQLIPVLIFPFIVAGIFFLMFTFVFKNMGSDMLADDIVPYVMAGFGLFFAAIIGYMIWAFIHDIRTGTKHRITGMITDKQLNIQTSHKRTSSGNSSHRTTRHYYIFIDEIKYKVDYKVYNQVKTGDQIQLERAPKSGVTLYLEVLETENTEAQSKTQSQIRNFVETKVDPVPMTEADLNHLKKQLLTSARRKLILNAPLLLIIFTMIYTGIGSLLIFIFPIVIIPAYQFYKIIRSVIHYFKNKSEGHKQGITALIDDKITISGNKTATKYKIKSTSGTLSVPEALYQQLAKNDKVIIFKSFYGHEPLSIVTMDQNEHYL